jgi:hypothetical protein
MIKKMIYSLRKKRSGIIASVKQQKYTHLGAGDMK